MDKEQDRLIRLSDAIEAMKKLADTKELNELGYGCSFLPEICAALREVEEAEAVPMADTLEVQNNEEA